MIKEDYTPIIKFLEANGFKEDLPERWVNGKCAVILKHPGILVSTDQWPDIEEFGYLYNKLPDIYWLVGVLTWYGLLSKEYVGGLKNTKE